MYGNNSCITLARFFTLCTMIPHCANIILIVIFTIVFRFWDVKLLRVYDVFSSKTAPNIDICVEWLYSYKCGEFRFNDLLK